VRTLLLGLLLLSPPALKPWLLRRLAGAQIGRDVQLGWGCCVLAGRIRLGDGSRIGPLTAIRLDGELHLGRAAEISAMSLIYGAGSVILGENSYIGPQSLINADRDVTLGHTSALGPRSVVFSHASYLPFDQGYWAKLAGVTLGDRVWCAAGVFLQPGVQIGDDSFVNARSVVGGTIPAGSLVRGNPAQVIGEMRRLRRRMTPARLDQALQGILRDYADLVLRRRHRLDQIDLDDGGVGFSWRGRAYRVVVVPSEADRPLAAQAGGQRTIYLVNRPAWTAPPGAAVLDLTSHLATGPCDEMVGGLRDFLRRFYGIRFR
jgi:acetyltransferase-like isoleucine patch superfamily enzyme